MSAGRRLVGLDLGGTAIKAGAVDAAGRVLEERVLKAPPFGRGPAAVLDAMAQLARDLGLAGSLGVGVPGLVQHALGRVLAAPNLPGFRELAVADELARRLDLPRSAVRIENDANAAALGEQWCGAARGEEDVLVLTLGTGIGGGLVLGGRLHVGAGFAGEVGHLVVDPAGPLCGCGARGCVETLASASAAERRAAAAGLPPEAPGNLPQLAARAREGRAGEAALLFEIGRDLGLALGAVICMLDVRTFVFGGGFAAALDVLEPGVRAGIAERAWGERPIRLLPAALGASAGWIGAARLALAGSPPGG